MRIIIVKMIAEIILGDDVETIIEIINEAFGKEERKENPRAKLILMEVMERE